MRKFLIAAASAVAVLGLAACSDTDETTTQSVEPEVQDPAAPEATPTEPEDQTGTDETGATGTDESMGSDEEQTSQ